MQVTVKLYASFRSGRFKEAVRECLPCASVADLVAAVGIPAGEIGIVVVNGSHAFLDEVLHEGDLVALMPRMGGGSSAANRARAGQRA